MKQGWLIIAVTLLLVVSSSGCSKMDGPEAAAKNSFSEWAVNIRMPYRHEKFQTIDNDGTAATVRIIVEMKIKGEWTQKQVDVHCQNIDQDWQCDRSIQFK